MDAVEAVLQHFGVKGMRWGVRNSVSTGGRKAAGSVVSADVKRASAAQAKIGRKGSTKALSNDELQALVKRMNLDKQYKQLTAQGGSSNPAVKMTKAGAKFSGSVVGGIAKQQVTRVGNDAATKYVDEFMKNATKKGAKT